MPAHLLDTNILLRSSDPDSSSYQSTRDCVAALASRKDELFITPQTLIEFWAVATRPIEVNGLGWDSRKAAEELRTILMLFPMLPDSPEIFGTWQRLVAERNVSGKRTHDARLVAVMLVYRVLSIVTLNPGDFHGFPDIKVIEPRDFL